MTSSATENSPIVRESRRFREAMRHPEDLVATFRGAGVYLECTSDPPAVPVVHVDGLPWLPVFSTLPYMARYLRERGRGGVAPLPRLIASAC